MARAVSTRSARLAWPLCLVLLLTVLGCSSKKGSAETAATAFVSQQYTVRGVVKDAAGLAGSPQRLRIHHEAVEDLLGADGEPDPMRAMVMSLVLERGTAVPADLGPDDKVEFVLDVAWQRSPVAVITQVERLDPSVELLLE